MDKALKQRLVGATVLVALAVIILPMLLGGQPDGPQSTRQIEIPPQPAELENWDKRRFPIGSQAPEQPARVPQTEGGPVLPESGAATEAPPEPSLQERLEAVAAAREETLETATEPEVAPPLVAPEDVQPAAETSGSNPPTVTNSDAPPDAPAGEAPEATGQSGAEPAPTVAAPVPETAPEPLVNPAQGATGRYVVQVASFSSPGNANRLAGSLRESGLPVIMDTVESAAGLLNRVRVGPYEQREAAEQILARLNSQMPDVRPRLVDLRPDEAAPVSGADDQLVRWVVQVGVFSGRQNAEKLVFSLRDDGYRASSRAETVAGATRYKVLIGPELDRAAAMRLRDRLAAERDIKGIVQSSE